MCPKKRLSGVKLLNPPGMERTLQSTRRIGYLAVDCFRAAACPRVMEEATLTFRLYRIASVINTLKLAPGNDETKQKEFLALLSFSFRLTPFKIGHVRYINILTWLRGFWVKNCKFLKFLLSLNSQKRLEYKENNTKYRSLTRKPRSHVRILIYRTWPIKRSWEKMSLWIGPIMSTVLLCFVNV